MQRPSILPSALLLSRSALIWPSLHFCLALCPQCISSAANGGGVLPCMSFKSLLERSRQNSLCSPRSVWESVTGNALVYLITDSHLAHRASQRLRISGMCCHACTLNPFSRIHAQTPSFGRCRAPPAKVLVPSQNQWWSLVPAARIDDT